MNKGQIKVVVWKADSRHNQPDKLKDFIDFWLELLNQVPIEYRDKVYLDQEISVFYDSPYYEAEIFYYREETDEEYNKRIDEENKRKESQKAKDLAEFNRLKQSLGL